ncbi:MAG: hypothetical protein IKC01_07180, partial [Clostridia bacterium]|nr:hypothetical protein [Clostridia bacterium]
NYRYAVRAVSGTTKGKYKSTGTIKYNVAPAVKVANTSNGVTVSWSAVANASGYTVYSSSYNEATKKWSAWKNRGTASADRTSWTDKKLKSGSAYKYTVRAVYDSFRSSYNKSGVSVRFLTQPTVKIASAGNGVKVSWTKVAGSKGYAIYRSQLSNGSWSGWKKMGTAASNKTAWVDRSAVGGASYRYTVRAVSGKHMSSFKSSPRLYYMAAPLVTVQNEGEGISVSWTGCIGANGYNVYRAVYNPHTGIWSSWVLIASTNNNTRYLLDEDVNEGVYYKYTVRGYAGSDNGAYVESEYIQRTTMPTEYSAHEKLKIYLISDGSTADDGNNKYIANRINLESIGYFTSVNYWYEDDSLTIDMIATIYETDTDIFISIELNEESEQGTIILYDPYGSQLYGEGYIYKDTFSNDNTDIYGFISNTTDASTETSLKEMLSVCVASALIQADVILRNSDAGVSLYDLGFTNY